MTPTEKLQHLVKIRVIGQKLADNITEAGKVEEFIEQFEYGCNKVGTEWNGLPYTPFANLQ